jgi:hypothetical protein
MSSTNSNEAYIFPLIESKGNIQIDKISSYDPYKLSSAKYFLDGFKKSFVEFYELFKDRIAHVPIQRYTDSQAADVKRKIQCFGEEPFGWLPNGWILADEHVYFYFGNEHDFHASYLYMSDAEWTKVRKLFSSTCSIKSPKGLYIGIDCAQMEQYKLFFKELYKAKREWTTAVSKVSSQVDQLIQMHEAKEAKQKEQREYDRLRIKKPKVNNGLREFVISVKDHGYNPIWDVSKINLENADLSELNLRGGRFCSSNLRNANLRNADISHTDFSMADLSNADLLGTKLGKYTSFRSANLCGARLGGLNFSGVSLSNADLTGADLTDASLVGAYMENAKFDGAIMTGVSGNPRN